MALHHGSEIALKQNQLGRHPGQLPMLPFQSQNWYFMIFLGGAILSREYMQDSKNSFFVPGGLGHGDRVGVAVGARDFNLPGFPDHNQGHPGQWPRSCAKIFASNSN